MGNMIIHCTCYIEIKKVEYKLNNLMVTHHHLINKVLHVVFNKFTFTILLYFQYCCWEWYPRRNFSMCYKCLYQDNLTKMVRWIRWNMIRTLAVWGQKRYVSEAPPNFEDGEATFSDYSIPRDRKKTRTEHQGLHPTKNLKIKIIFTFS